MRGENWKENLKMLTLQRSLKAFNNSQDNIKTFSHPKKKTKTKTLSEKYSTVANAGLF